MMQGLPTILDRLNLTQIEFAEAIGVTEQTVSRWVNDHFTPSSENLVATLEFLQKRDPAITLSDLKRAA